MGWTEISLLKTGHNTLRSAFLLSLDLWLSPQGSRSKSPHSHNIRLTNSNTLTEETSKPEVAQDNSKELQVRHHLTKKPTNHRRTSAETRHAMTASAANQQPGFTQASREGKRNRRSSVTKFNKSPYLLLKLAN